MVEAFAHLRSVLLFGIPLALLRFDSSHVFR